LDHQGTVLRTVVGYYRALVRLPEEHPELAARLLQPPCVPMLAIWGDRDPVREAAAGEQQHFATDYRQVLIAGAGHFVHREQPEKFNELLISWLRAAILTRAGGAWCAAARCRHASRTHLRR
jgi:pimeloyl-ACP methyl ester carboxylesterase